MAVIRPYQPGDEQEICRLFATVFRQELSLASWQWKYQRGGDPPPIWVAEEEGRIVCHYGALRQPMRWQGEEWEAWDIVDVMCHPQYQGRGLFRRTAHAFISQLRRSRQSLMIYGFPGERHRRLGELLTGYAPVARIYKVRKTLPSALPTCPAEVGVLETLPPDWDLRWRSVEERFGLVGRRDRAFVTWRYLSRPGKRYRLLTFAGTTALAVVGIEQGKAYLLEFLLAPAETVLATRLLAAVEAVSRRAGAEELEGWFAPFAWESKFLTGPGRCTGEEADHYLECRLFDPRLSPAWLAEHLYYSLGDYDVF